MKTIIIYLDTSVIGGVFDDEFTHYSKLLIQQIVHKKINGVISEVTIRELENAPRFVIEDFKKYAKFLEIIAVTDEMRELAEIYVKEKIVSNKYYEDTLHIACATVYPADILVSWNFKHIVNFNKINQFNAVNIKNSYKALQIYSPMEVIGNEK